MVRVLSFWFLCFLDFGICPLAFHKFDLLVTHVVRAAVRRVIINSSDAASRSCDARFGNVCVALGIIFDLSMILLTK